MERGPTKTVKLATVGALLLQAGVTWPRFDEISGKPAWAVRRSEPWFQLGDRQRPGMCSDGDPYG